MLHRYIEGERVGVDGRKIFDVDRRPDRCPGGTPAPPEARGREPPSFFFFLAPQMGGEFPLWSMASMAAEGREPLQDWISLSVLFCLAFFRSGQKPFLIFLEIRNSNCTEILTRYFPDISFLAPEVELQPMFEESTTHQKSHIFSSAPWCLVGCVGLHLQ